MSEPDLFATLKDLGTVALQQLATQGQEIFDEFRSKVPDYTDKGKQILGKAAKYLLMAVKGEVSEEDAKIAISREMDASILLGLEAKEAGEQLAIVRFKDFVIRGLDIGLKLITALAAVAAARI